MDQYWVCQHCKSLNRGGTTRCYRCREKLGSVPAPVTPKSAPPPSAIPAPPRRDAESGDLPPAYISRPVVPSPGPASFTASAAAAAAEARRGPAGPVTVIKRRISRALAARPVVGVRVLGWLTMFAILAALVAGAALTVMIVPVATDLLKWADAPHAWAQLSAGSRTSVIAMGIVAAAAGALALLLFSIFIGLTTHNAPALGADMPILTPYAAGVAWVRGLWRHAEIAFCAAAPTVVVWLGWTIPGVILAIVLVEIALHRIEDPWAWFRAPNRHVPDLYVKLGTAGSMESLTASTWALLFRVANSLAVVLWLVPPAALVANVAVSTAGWGSIPGWQAGSMGPLQWLVAAFVAATLLAGALSALLLVPLVLGFARRQGARRDLVRGGRARSWGGRPSAADYVAPVPGAGRPESWDDDNRIVDRTPRGSPAGEGDPLLQTLNQRPRGPQPVSPGPFARVSGGTPPTGSTPGGAPGPGAGAPPAAGLAGADESPDRSPGRGLASNDQASLNSPSTTSSFPWSEPPDSE